MTGIILVELLADKCLQSGEKKTVKIQILSVLTKPLKSVFKTLNIMCIMQSLINKLK